MYLKITANASSVVQTGLMDDGVKVALLGVWMALFVVFAGRKFSQPVKVDSLYHHIELLFIHL